MAKTRTPLAIAIPSHIPGRPISRLKQKIYASGIPSPYANRSVMTVFLFCCPNALTIPFCTPFIVLKKMYKNSDIRLSLVDYTIFSSSVKIRDRLSSNNRKMVSMMNVTKTL